MEKVKLSLINKGFKEVLESDFIDELNKLYNGGFVNQELRKMHAWVLANPHKSKKHWKRFIVNWLNRAQERNQYQDKFKTLLGNIGR